MPPRRDARGRFVAGSGARPEPDARYGDFVSELETDWRRHGVPALEQVREGRPQDYLRLVASNLAGRGATASEAIEAMSDDEIADELRRVLEKLAAAGLVPGA